MDFVEKMEDNARKLAADIHPRMEFVVEFTLEDVQDNIIHTEELLNLEAVDKVLKE